ncbi:MAG: PsbP-related protein, partial [Promethearchaeota archaeon]
MKGEKVYEKSGFRIKYPKKWKTKNVGAGYTAQFFNKRGMFETNLTVVIQDLSDAESIPTLDEYFEANINTLKQIEEDARDFQIRNRKVSNLEGKELIYSGTSFTSDVFLKHLIFFTLT